MPAEPRHLLGAPLLLMALGGVAAVGVLTNENDQKRMRDDYNIVAGNTPVTVRADKLGCYEHNEKSGRWLLNKKTAGKLVDITPPGGEPTAVQCPERLPFDIAAIGATEPQKKASTSGWGSAVAAERPASPAAPVALTQ